MLQDCDKQKDKGHCCAEKFWGICTAKSKVEKEVEESENKMLVRIRSQ